MYMYSVVEAAGLATPSHPRPLESPLSPTTTSIPSIYESSPINAVPLSIGQPSMDMIPGCRQRHAPRRPTPGVPRRTRFVPHPGTHDPLASLVPESGSARIAVKIHVGVFPRRAQSVSQPAGSRARDDTYAVGVAKDRTGQDRIGWARTHFPGGQMLAVYKYVHVQGRARARARAQREDEMRRLWWNARTWGGSRLYYIKGSSPPALPTHQ
jgi:hypothetical protein